MLQTKIVSGFFVENQYRVSLESEINATVASLENNCGMRVRDIQIFPCYSPKAGYTGTEYEGLRGYAVICFDDSAEYEENHVEREDAYHRGGGIIDKRPFAEKMKDIMDQFPTSGENQ